MSKKLLTYGLMGLAAFAFTSCANDDEPGYDQGNGGQQGGVVKTAFAISIGSGSQNSRQSADIVQADGEDFRGMDNIAMACANLTGTINVDALTNASGLTWVNLPEISGVTTANSKKVYKDVTIPVNTNTFFFYGKAKLDNVTDLGAIAGYTNFTPSGATTSAIKFTPKSICEASALIAKTEAVDILAALNALSTAINGTEYATAFRTGNAGSSAAVLKRVQSLVKTTVDASVHTVTDLWTEIDDENDDDATKSHKTAIQKVFALSAYNVVSYKTGYDNFPAQYGMPDGTALLAATDAGVFSYITSGQIGVNNNPKVPVSSVVYPAELLYYVASPVKATATEATSETVWSQTAATWIDNTPIPAIAEANWTTSIVSTTKTVAMVNNVNYGVAQLQTKVKVATAAETNLEALDATNATVEIPTNKIKFNGIVVGGQPDKVGYNMLGTSVFATYDRALYDKVETPYVLTATAPATPLYTLVYDSYANVGNNIVNVALEFEYDKEATTAFKAEDGVIYPGMKFYMIGVLDPDSPTSSGLATANWESLKMKDRDIYFPAYNTKRPFVQDFTTTANYTISNLNHCYIGIPDLRTTLLSFGLSVDLAWKAGLQFEVEIN